MAHGLHLEKQWLAGREGQAGQQTGGSDFHLNDLHQSEIINCPSELDMVPPTRRYREGFRTAAKEGIQQALSPQISLGQSPRSDTEAVCECALIDQWIFLLIPSWLA